MLYQKFYNFFATLKSIFSRQITTQKTAINISPKLLLQLFVYCMTFAILFIGLKSFAQEKNVTSAQNIQKELAENVVRLHVIANSDNSADQSLKLIVRDNIITSLQKKLKNAVSVTDAKEIILENQNTILSIAQKTLYQHNSGYSVTVSLQPRYFPVKQYGDLTFPAGMYQALCVEIGEAKGQNWWCVLFPSLCFVDETTAVVPDESKKKLQESLSSDAYESLENTDRKKEQDSSYSDTDEEALTKEKPEVRSGILDWFVNLS